MKLKTPTLPTKAHHTGMSVGATQASVQPPPPHPSTLIRSSAHPIAATPAPGANPSTAMAPASPLRKAAGGITAPARRRNAAVMIAGAALIIIAGALGASVAASFDDSIDVLVAAGPIAEGQTITENDFRSVKIAAGEGDIQAVSPNSAEQLVGRVAAGPIGEGAMIHPSQFTVAAAETQIVIGAALDPNQYPASGLKPGDHVRLIEVGGRFGSTDEGFTSGAEVAVGEITDVVALSLNKIHFSVRVPESSANVVAQRIAEDRLVLALVDQSITLERVDPLEPASPVVPLEIESVTPGNEAGE